MPKVVLLMDNPSVPTGYGSTCRLTAKELKKRGWEVYAMAFNGGVQSGKNNEDIFDLDGVNVIRNFALEREKNAIYGDAEAILKVEELIEPDIYFWHNDSYRYGYIRDLPQKITEKSVYWLPFEGEAADPGLEVFGRCSAIRFVTQHALNLHKEHLKDKDKDVGFIYHAVDLEHMRPTTYGAPKNIAKREKNLNLEGKFVVARVDRHQPRKRWELTLEAFAKFAKDKDDVFMLCKCNPRDVTMFSPESGGMDLELVAKDLGISEKIFFDDYFFDTSFMPHGFYHPADVFLTTTSGEGFGLAVAEAMACGCPVVFHDVPVLPEVVGDTGFKFKRAKRQWYDKMSVWHNIADTDDAAAQLQAAYEDWKKGGNVLQEKSQKAVERAEQNFNPQIIYDQWDEVMRDVMEKCDLVSVITVLYNVTKEQIHGADGVEKLRQTMEEYVKFPHEWIIVDNGSPYKETQEWLSDAASKNKRIKPLFLTTNRGFAGGCNAGLEVATGKNVVLMNPDSQVVPPEKHGFKHDFVKLMQDKLRNDPTIGVLGMEIKSRDDIMSGAKFPYFCCVMISRECLEAVKTPDGKYFDENFWPAYYEDLDFCIRAQAKGFKVEEDKTLPFWHISGGTNKHVVEKPPEDPRIKSLLHGLERLKKEGKMRLDFDRKFGELASSGMQGVISGNIKYLNSKWGVSARQKVRVVWHCKIGEAVGFSEIAEGLIPEMYKLGFDVYVNDWNNGSKISDPLIKTLYEKTKKAKESGEDLHDSIHIVCWLMETFADVDGAYKIGVSFCESTRVRDSYLHLCNSMDGIMTFSNFCKRVQIDSGFRSPIHVITPAVSDSYVNFHRREEIDKIIETKGKFSFLCVGVSQGRKDTYRLVQAFTEAFPKDADHPPEEAEGFPLKCSQVELVIKSNNFGELGWVHEQGFSERANIKTIFTGAHEKAERHDLSKEEMYDLYCNSEALVHPSHGEGIGLPILEGAATGLPVIFTDWSSPSEYLDELNSYPIQLSPYPGTSLTKAYPDAPGDNGLWANMHVGHLKHLMYSVIKEWDEARARGQRAHNLIKSKYVWKESINLLWPLLMQWDEERKVKPKNDNEFDPLTFEGPTLEPIEQDDRIIIDVPTRDRHPYLGCLLISLLHQTFKNWDIIIQVDDADESILQDHLIMSLMKRLEAEGHGWNMIRSHRQGPHMAHQRTLQMAIDKRAKLVCRIDDDIYVEPDYLEKLFNEFLADKKCKLGAVGGVYLDPRRKDEEQVAPPDWKTNVEYAGLIDHNVPWPYICRYPQGTNPRNMEHLYSSFLYRVEIAKAIGGYCKLFSQIGFREESDFSYRFWLAGYQLRVHPEAVGYHFSAPYSGVRSMDINEKEALCAVDDKIYARRLAKWKAQAQKRKELESAQQRKLQAEATQMAKKQSTGKIACVINGRNDPDSIELAIKRFAPMVDYLYVTCDLDSKDHFSDIMKDEALALKVKAICIDPSESVVVAQNVVSQGDHEFVMTVSDKMQFQGDPKSVLSPDYDEYVFEVYDSYVTGKEVGNAFIPDETDDVVVGPECRNMCLIFRRNCGKPPLEKVLYSDMMVVEDKALRPKEGLSRFNNPLLAVKDMTSTNWTKICVYQHPEGELKTWGRREMTNGKPLVSIVIPTPGRKTHLKRCLDSIYSYTSTPFEVVVVDNGSSDGTAEMLEKEQKTRPNIKVLTQGKNLGFQKGVNIGVGKTQGKYVLIFNDDAWIEKPEPEGGDWLGVLIKELESDPKVGIVGPHMEKSPSLGKDILMFWCVMFRKETWDDVGPLDDVTFLNYGGDDDYCERLREKGYEIRQKYVHLRHLMNLVPESVKNRELEESRVKLRSKYNVG